MIYFTVTGTQFCFGMDAFKIGQKVYLEKEEDNEYDAEAIMVLGESGMKLGHVANSVRTVAKGTHSAGWLSHEIGKNAAGEVLFITGSSVIAKLIVPENEENMV